MTEQFEIITEESIGLLVSSFYRRVRDDALLAPVFEKAIGTTDEAWNPHLELIGKFWLAVMLGINGYEGNPLQAHKALPSFDARLFSRWLALFANTAMETHGLVPATTFIRKAVSIANMMVHDLYGSPDIAPEMPVIPDSMKHYRTTPPFQAASIPNTLRRSHKTASGVYGRIVVSKGRLLYTIGNSECHVLSPGLNGTIEPEKLHFVTPLDEAEFVVEFYRDPLLSLSKGTSSS